MDLIEEIGGAIDSVFDLFDGPIPEAHGCRSSRSRSRNKKPSRPCGYVVVASDAPRDVLKRGETFRSKAELGTALQKAARHLQESGGRRHYAADVRRLSDGAEHRVYINRYDADQPTNWFRGAVW
jgi:hypothetical protein